MRSPNDKVVESIWFTPKTTAPVGIVMVQTEYDGLVFYIGLGSGLNETTDENMVAERGAPFPYRVGIDMFGEEIT